MEGEMQGGDCLLEQVQIRASWERSQEESLVVIMAKVYPCLSE
jgi:hypothetical protein